MKLISVLLCSLAISSTAARNDLYLRQNTALSTGSSLTTTSPPSGTAGDDSKTTSTRSTGSGLPSGAASSTATSSQSTDSANSTSGDIFPSGTTTGLLVATTNGAKTTTPGDPAPLPLTPKITPAIGIAGALLMITGLAYSLVGIKNKWLYSFFGVAYLVALAVTVLIIYCMNPPVSNSVQGAFLVAVVFAGCLSGGAALVFRDLADGVGCLLGGFCLAMWFLCLKDGGLIPSVIGKSIFIGCMSVAVFSLSLHPRTHTYALIGSIPFSGATATVLGIDCFSRAGLKEFWIYVWEINDNEFPLNTNTYPMTRGIRVEIAGIILLFLLGLVTQLKLAKIVRQRREQKNTSREQREKDLEREEAAAGQRVERTIERERVRWENVYGGSKSQSSTAASFDTLGKSMGSVREKRVSALSDLELSEISSTRDKRESRQSRATVTVTQLEDDTDEIQRARSHGNHRSASDRVPFAASRSSRALSSLPSPELGPTESARSSLPPPAPEVIPLPFMIPGIEIDAPPSNQGSLSAIEESYMNRRLGPKRRSDASSAVQRLSIGQTLPEATASQEDLVTPHDDDGASSLAATFDELDEDAMSLSAMTVPRSPMDADFGQPSPRLSHIKTSNPPSLADEPIDLSVETSKPSGSADGISRMDAQNTKPERESKQTPLDLGEKDASKPLTGTIPRETEGKIMGTATSDCQHNDTNEKQQPTTTTHGQEETTGQSDAAQAPVTGNLADHLPDNMSRVVLQYRTNEWAKHLSLAETPEPDELADPHSPGIKLDTSFEAESSKDRTPLSPVVDPDRLLAPARPISKRLSTTPTIHEEEPVTVLPPTHPLQSSPTTSRTHSWIPDNQTPPIASLSRNSSTANMPPSTLTPSLRNSSHASLGQPIAESPVESPVERIRPGTLKRVGSDAVPAPLPSDTLLGQRDSRMKSKPKKMAFAQSTPSLALTGSNLAQSQQQSAPRISSRQGSRPPPLQATFDSHQPQRGSGVSQVKRENRLNEWRESLRQEQKPQASIAAAPGTDERLRARMINEKREKQYIEEQEKLAKEARSSQLDLMMRNGNMIDAHKQALRNMQANAKI